MGLDPEGEEKEYLTTESAEKNSVQLKDIFQF
jgi:hypothetical protein